MDEILALQAALAQAQLADTAHRISERNAVELILKLIDMKKVQLIFTKSGREYLTPQQLVVEVERELVAAGGRLPLTELAPLLNVDLNHVEVAARTLTQKNKKVVELAGQLLTSAYMDGVCEEINEALQETGSVALVELAQRFHLAMDFLREAIQERLGGSIQGYIEEGQLYTHSFLHLHAARTRGILRALGRPTPLRSLLTRHSGLMESRLAKEVTQLIEKGEVNGTLKGQGDRAIYTPALFLRAQQRGVDSFFSTNGYVEYSKLERLGISNPKQYLSTTYPHALLLSSLALSQHIVSGVVMACEDARAANLFVHGPPLLPSMLTKQEVEQVVKEAIKQANGKKEGEDKAELMLVGEGWAVSSAIKEEAYTQLEQQMDKWLDEEDAKRAAALAAAAAAAAAASSTAATSSSATAAPSKKPAPPVDSEDEEDDEPSSKKGGKGGKKKGGKAGKDVDEDRSSSSKGGKDKDKKKRRNKRAVSSDEEEEDEPVAPVKSKSKSKAVGAAGPPPLTRDRVHGWLKQLWSSIVSRVQTQQGGEAGGAAEVEGTEELVSALATLLHPSLLASYKKKCAERAAAAAAALASSSSSSATSGGAPTLIGVPESVLRRQQVECLRANVQELYENLLIYQHAIEYLNGGSSGESATSPVAAASSSSSAALIPPSDKLLLTQLDSHLSKTLCTSLTDLLIRLEVFTSLTPAQQRNLPGMDHIVVLAPASAENTTPTSKYEVDRTPLSQSERDAALSALPARSASALRPVLDSLTKTPALFLDSVESASKSLELPLKRLDKKTERTRVFTLRKSLMASLATEQKAAVVLHLTVLLLVAKVHSVVVHAPAKSIPHIRRMLRSSVSPAAYGVLRRFNQLVVRALRGDAADASAVAASDSESEEADLQLPEERRISHMSLEAVQQELAANLEAVRAFGMDPSSALPQQSK